MYAGVGGDACPMNWFLHATNAGPEFDSLQRYFFCFYMKSFLFFPNTHKQNSRGARISCELTITSPRCEHPDCEKQPSHGDKGDQEVDILCHARTGGHD